MLQQVHHKAEFIWKVETLILNNKDDVVSYYNCALIFSLEIVAVNTTTMEQLIIELEIKLKFRKF